MKTGLNMKYILALLFIILALNAFSQDCTGYHQFHCQYADYTFFYSRQSKSALFRRGQSSELRIVAYGGEDYYIAVCAHRKFGNIHFRILEDSEDSIQIFDNAEHEYVESIIFTNEVTRNLIIEVSVPEGTGKESKERRCVGVVVQFRKTDFEPKKSRRTGF
jgi:hypothetical protein